MTNPNEHSAEAPSSYPGNSVGDITPAGDNLAVSHVRPPLYNPLPEGEEADKSLRESQANEILRAKLNLETAQMAWSEMQRYFASGAAIYISPSLDLVEAALQMSEDNTTLIGEWMAAGQFGKVTDEQARIWLEADETLWVVVISPWVLVQPVTSQRQ